MRFGRITLELTSADIPRICGQLLEGGIELEDFRQEQELVACFSIPIRDYNRAARLAEKRGDQLRIIGRQGVYWQIKRWTGRPVLIVGWMVILLLTLLLPGRILLVEVEGNRQVEAKRILAEAGEAGLHFWTERESLRNEQMKNHLLSQIPQLKWAGINTIGCRAVISVREEETEKASAGMLSDNIVADRSGIIISSLVHSGTGLCVPGEAVEEGQLLISGYRDCEGMILQTKAQGEVYAQTRRELQVYTPGDCQIRRGEGRSALRFSILLGKKRINLWKGSGICPGSCGRMYTEYWLTLPGGFRLPLGLAQERITAETAVKGNAGDRQLLLKQAAGQELLLRMIAGQVLEEQENIRETPTGWLLEGEYLCREQIGRGRRQEIGEYHEQND